MHVRALGMVGLNGDGQPALTGLSYNTSTAVSASRVGQATLRAVQVATKENSHSPKPRGGSSATYSLQRQLDQGLACLR